VGALNRKGPLKKSGPRTKSSGQKRAYAFFVFFFFFFIGMVLLSSLSVRLTEVPRPLASLLYVRVPPTNVK